MGEIGRQVPTHAVVADAATNNVVGIIWPRELQAY